MPAALKRLLAALVTLAVFCGQGSALLHYVVVPHHLCLRHGALEHGQAEGNGAAAASNSAEKERALAGQTIASGEDEHEHERCSVPARLEQKGAGVARPEVVHAQLIADDASVPPTAVAVSRSALLLMAPKQSPPILALA